MKFIQTLALLTLAPFASAYPFVAELTKDIAKRQAPGVTPPFDAAQQYVSNQGQYAFVAPGPGDSRGPCPGLNAMANHGYMPHNGVGNMIDFVDGTFAAFGMGPDLAEFLAVYGGIFDGNILTYSIGGPTPAVIDPLLLGEPMGLAGSHNKYEGDVSPVRGDLYQYGNDYENQMSQFKELYALGEANGGSIDLPLLTNYRVTRFNQSIHNNPYFFNAPFSGVIASPAAWSFVYRFMANHTAEHPEGLLDLETLKSFYAITGDTPDEFVYTPGHEKFPDNWYRRNNIDAYTIPYFIIDNLEMALAHPQFLSIGGNTGQVNTFTGLAPEDLTGGIYNLQTLTQGNNLFCYAMQLTVQEAPDLLSGLFTDIDPAMDALGAAIDKATDGLGCAKLNGINKGQFAAFPGYTQLKSDGTY